MNGGSYEEYEKVCSLIYGDGNDPRGGLLHAVTARRKAARRQQRRRHRQRMALRRKAHRQRRVIMRSW